MPSKAMSKGAVLAGVLAMGALTGSAAGTSRAQQNPTRTGTEATCRDSDGGLYSAGALLELRGRLMRCVIGPHWVPFDGGASEDSTEVLDVTGVDVSARLEAHILKTFQGRPLPELKCDSVLHSERPADRLLETPPDGRLLLVFWTPTCVPCKPVLAEVAALAATKPRGLAFLGVVQAADPDLEPPGDWQLSRVEGILAQQKASFPTCVHRSPEVTKSWQAGGVPLTLLVTANGVEQVAMGAANGHKLVQAAAEK